MPGRIRTCDLRIRNPLLYPTELRARTCRAIVRKTTAEKMVGAARLELATPRSQSECATNCATPRHKLLKFQYPKIYDQNGSGVSDGARTRGIQNHNLTLYQLSYAHRDYPEKNLISLLDALSIDNPY